MDQIEKILFDDSVGKIVTVIIGVILIWAIGLFVQKKFLTKISDTDNRYRAKKFASFIAWFFVLIFITTVYSNKLGGITVALGVAGAGIAFALQEVIASVGGWLAVMFGGFYKTGDRVQLGGIKGDVIDIGVLRTTVMELGQWVDGDLYNGRIVRIANSFVFKEPVFNYSADFPFLWDEIKIPIQYGSDYQIANSIILKAGVDITDAYSDEAGKTWGEMNKKYLVEDATTKPMVTRVANDRWVEFTLRYVVNFKKRRITKDALFKQILDEIEQTSGKVKMAYSTLEIVGIPKLNVEVKNN